MKLNIVQFTFGLGLGGQERVVVDLAKAFQREGHISIVCTILSEGELAAELRSIGINVNCFGLKRSYDLRGLLPVMRYLRKVRADVIISHGASSSWIPRIAAILMRTPAFIHVEHNVSYKHRFVFNFFNKMFCAFADKIVCVSNRARESFIEIVGIPAARVTCIPNGIDHERFNLMKHRMHSSNNHPKRVGIIGRFQEQKGHLYFVQAAARIVKSFQNVEFVFIGDGPMRPLVQNTIQDYGIEKHCILLGYRTDIAELLPTIDVFVLASLWEGLPITLLEAQCLGIASVVTDVGGNPEVIENGFNGLLVPPKSPAQLSEAILKILTDKPLRVLLGQNAKTVFANKFTIERMAQCYLDLIHNILRAKGLYERDSRLP